MSKVGIDVMTDFHVICDGIRVDIWIYWSTLDAVTCLADNKTTVAIFQLSIVLLIVVAKSTKVQTRATLAAVTSFFPQ